MKTKQELLTRALHDPAAFAMLLLDRERGDVRPLPRLHRELQLFLSRHRRALIELPRDHGKSTQVCARIIWELGRNPNLRVKLVCANAVLAGERSRFIRDAIIRHRYSRQVFPWLAAAYPWNAERFTVARAHRVIGPSVAAFGIGGRSTGARADLLVCDDIVDVTALRSKSDRERVRTFFHENLMNLLEPDGRVWCLFTPWHVDDLNSHLKRNAAFAHFRRAIGEDLEPIWPEHWPRERLEQRRREIGELSFARAYRLVSLSDKELAIQAKWIQFWTEPTPNESVVLAVDPAVSTAAQADASALVVLGRTAANDIRCLEAISRRVSAPDLVTLIDEADRRWSPDAILFESNAGFAAVRDLLLRHARFGPKIHGIVQSRDKAARIRAFSVQVQNGKFHLRGAVTGGVAPGQQALFDEMTTFPGGEHDDLVDAAAFGAEWLLAHPQPRVWLP
jgi:predicted phage terminase large subunit-like protein